MKYFLNKHINQNFLFSNTAVVSLIIFANLILIPILTQERNQNILLYLNYVPIVYLLIISIILIFFISIFLFYLTKIIDNKIISLFLLFVLIWTIIFGICFPIGGNIDLGIIRKFEIHIIYLILIKILIVCLILYYLDNKKLINSFIIFVSIYFLLNFIYFYINISQPVERVDFSKLTKYSKKENFIILSFDGISSIDVEKAINESIKLKTDFKDFTIYKNFNAQYPATYGQFINEIFGGFDKDTDYKKFRKREMFNYINSNRIIIKNKDINLNTYGQYGLFFDGEVNKHIQPNIEELSSKEYLYFYIKEIILPSFRRNISHPININIQNYFNNKDVQKFIFNKDLKLSNTNHLSINDFYKFKSNIIIDEKKDYTIKFLHFNFTHNPVEYDDKCQNKYYDLKWKESITLPKQSYLLTKCVLKLINEFIFALKDKNLFHNTTFILKSDHGRLKHYFNQYPQNLTINNNKYFSKGRYEPFLMIKKKNTNNDNLIFNETFIYSSDLSYYFCEIMLRNDCKKNISFDLIKNKTNKSKKIYEFFLPKNKNSYIYPHNMEIIDINTKKTNLRKYLESTAD